MRNWVWVVGLVVVLGVVAWLAVGSDLFGGATAIDRTRGGGGDAAREGGADAATGGTDPSSREGSHEGPILFGRPSAQRVGLGGVVGKVMDFATGKPVAGARVLLAGTGHGQESVQARAETGADGAIALREIPAGDAYSLRVDAEGQPPRALPSVAVTAGEVLDLGTIWLGKKGALEGVVVDVEGKPIPDAAVAVHRALGGMAEMMQNVMDMIERLDEEPTPLAKTQTDRGGRFRIEDLAPGPQTLLARAPGFARRWLEVTMTSDGAAGGEVRVVLQRGQTAGGKVVDEQGAGIAGARVAVLANSAGPDEFFYGRTFTETAHDGSFRIDVLPDASELTALAAVRGYPNTFAKVHAGSDDAVIVMHKVVPLNLRLLTKEGGAPVVGASVVVGIDDSADDAGDMPGTMLFGRSDASGRVALQGRPGKLQMAIVTHPDFAANMWMGRSGMGGIMGMEGPEDPTVPADGKDVTFRLQAGILVTGRVTGPEGEPIVGARVLSAGGFMGGKPSLTDADGRYRMSSPSLGQVGAVAVMVRASGYVQPQASMGATAEAGAKELVHDVRMERSATVTGRVVDATGAPKAGATVSLTGGDPTGMGRLLGGSSNVSAEDGSYLLEDAAAAQGVRVKAHLEGYVDSSSEPFDVKAGTTVSAPPVVMRVGVGVEVTVLEPGGARASGARVQAAYEHERDFAFSMRDEDDEAVTGDDGVARFSHLPGGKVTFTVSKRGFAASQVETETPKEEGAQHAVPARLRKALPVRGTVKDGEGKPMAGVRVRVQGSGSGDDWVQWASVTTKADGAFAFDETPDRPLKLQANKDGFAETTTDVDRLREGLEVVLRPVDPRVAKRRDEVNAQMTALWQQYQAAKDEEEKKAILQKIQELSKELRNDTGSD